MKNVTLQIWLCQFMLIFLCGSSFGQADLSLTMDQANQSPSQYSLYSVTATVSNDGPQNATGVDVHLPIPAGVVYQGGNEFTTNRGNFLTFGSNAGRWRVGSLAAGSSATITINYFLNAPTAATSYAEVSASDQSDPDSTPGNGNGVVNEDDEASSDGSGPPAGQADLQARNLRVQNPSIAAGTNLEYRFNIRNGGTANVPGDFTVKSYISTDNVLSPDDIQDGAITTGNFDAGAMVQNILGASSTNGLTPGNYFVIVFVDADDVISESNESNNTRVAPFTITGNTGGGDIDLSLTLSQNVASPPQYTLYSVTSTVSNAGPQTATGVVVDLPLPAGVVYEGGNESSASQGSLVTYGSNQGRWNVGSLGVSQSATITINYFRGGATASDSYAEVLAATETDSDSTPGNGNGQVNEDDEASTGGGSSPTCSFTASLLSVDCSNAGTPNDPSDDTYSIVVSAENPSSIAGSWQSSNFPVGAAYGQSIREDIGRISFNPSGQIIMVDVANSSCRDTLSFTAPTPCSGSVTGACTFEEPATINQLDQQFSTDINATQTANGFELTALSGPTFNNSSRRVAVYNFDADGSQVSSSPAVTNFTFTENVGLDFQNTEFIINNFNGGTTTVPFTDPAPAGSPGSYEGGFTARLPDGSGYLVFVRQIELNGANPDVTTLRSFRINNNYQQVGGVTTYPAMPTRYEAATFLAPSGQGNYFLRIIERGTNSTYVLVNNNYSRLGAVSLGVNGRFFQPFEFQELGDGTFSIVSFFDGADPSRALRISRYNRNGSLVNEYFSSSSFLIGRDPFQGAIRQDGGFVGVSGKNASGSTIEVRDGNGTLLAENYLDGLFSVDILGVTSDMSILILANRGTVNGQRVFIKLTNLGEQDCNQVDPCDPTQTEPTSAILNHSIAPGGIVTVEHNLFGMPGTITLDAPTRLGITLIDPSTFTVNSVVNVRGRIFITGTLRDNVNPGSARPFVLETDNQERDINSVLPTLTQNDLNSFNVIGDENFATIIVEYFTFGRGYGIAKIQSGNVIADEFQVGDLVTNRINGAVINEDDGVIYLSYRNGNSNSWPRMRVLDLSDLSTIGEVRLADAIFSSNNGSITGDTGFPNVLSTGDVAVAFVAFDGNSPQQVAAIVDPLANLVSTVLLPNLSSPQGSTYVATGTTPNGDVRFTNGSTQVALLGNGMVTTCSGGPTQGVDLELTASSASNQPQIYDTNSITVSVTNTGTQNASGVVVNIPRPADVVYTGGNEFTASQGSLATYGSDEGEWTVGNLAAGETATIVVSYFSLSATGYDQFAEVIMQNETDADSTPGNGTGTSATEDDEAFLNLTSGARSALTLNVYPNPAPTGEQIILKHTSSGNIEVPLLISDLNGRTVFQTSIQFAEGYNVVPVSIGNLSAGVYILSLSDTGLQPTRLVVR